RDLKSVRIIPSSVEIGCTMPKKLTVGRSQFNIRKETWASSTIGIKWQFAENRARQNCISFACVSHDQKAISFQFTFEKSFNWQLLVVVIDNRSKINLFDDVEVHSDRGHNRERDHGNADNCPRPEFPS